MGKSIRVIKWGMIEYERAMWRQTELVHEVAAGAPNTLVLCEHPKTLTMGRKYDPKNLFIGLEELALRGFSLVKADRGGDITLHAPGQLVIYPIIDLKQGGRDLGAYLRKLEQTCVDFLRDFDIVAKGDQTTFDERSEDEEKGQRRGVWVDRAKIASIGIGVSRWVTYHGMAVNIKTDLGLFSVIRPCGLDVRMTSVKKLTGRSLAMSAAADKFEEHFLKVFHG